MNDMMEPTMQPPTYPATRPTPPPAPTHRPRRVFATAALATLSAAALVLAVVWAVSIPLGKRTADEVARAGHEMSVSDVQVQNVGGLDHCVVVEVTVRDPRTGARRSLDGVSREPISCTREPSGPHTPPAKSRYAEPLRVWVSDSVPGTVVAVPDLEGARSYMAHGGPFYPALVLLLALLWGYGARVQWREDNPSTRRGSR